MNGLYLIIDVSLKAGDHINRLLVQFICVEEICFHSLSCLHLTLLAQMPFVSTSVTFLIVSCHSFDLFPSSSPAGYHDDTPLSLSKSNASLWDESAREAFEHNVLNNKRWLPHAGLWHLPSEIDLGGDGSVPGFPGSCVLGQDTEALCHPWCQA